MHQVMAVDDDSLMRGLLERLLIDAGYEARLCPDAATCLLEMDREKPDLLLLDVDLPDGDGIALCASIKKNPRLRDVVVVLVSGEAVDLGTRVAGLNAGADDYILKPFDRRELLARIAGILRQTCPPPRRSNP